MRFPQDAAEFFNRVGGWRRLGRSDEHSAFRPLAPTAKPSQHRRPLSLASGIAAYSASNVQLDSLTKGPRRSGTSRWRCAATSAICPLPGIFLDYSAPFRDGTEGRELVMARWGMPSPRFALKGRNSDQGVTNIRNVSSPHWRRWLGVDSRCVVPFSSFSENEVFPDGSRPPGKLRTPRRHAGSSRNCASSSKKPRPALNGCTRSNSTATEWRRASRRAMGRNQP